MSFPRQKARRRRPLWRGRAANRARGRHRAWLLLLLACCGAPPTPYPSGVALSVTRGPEEPRAMPAFGWPPKDFTGYLVLPRHTLLGDARVLGDVVEKLQRFGPEGRFFSIGDDGFAWATSLRCIDDDGRLMPYQGAACLDANSPDRAWFSVDDYLQALFGTRPGRFRMFVVLVTPRTFGPDGAWSMQQAQEHVARGATHVPASLANAPVAADTRATVLLYEFVREGYEDASAHLVPSSRVSARQHALLEGLFSEAELQ